MQMFSSPSRALRLILVLVALVFAVAACSRSDDGESAEVEATPTAEPTETSTTESDAGEEESSTEPRELPTIDVEAALEGIDTDTPPDPVYCVMSDYLDSDEWDENFNVAISGGATGAAAIADIAAHFEAMEAIAPDDLKEDVVNVGDAMNDYLTAVAEAVDTDDFVDATALQERFAEIQQSGARLGAYDQVVCGNVARGEGNL
jgi:hypothetical protein